MGQRASLWLGVLLAFPQEPVPVLESAAEPGQELAGEEAGTDEPAFTRAELDAFFAWHTGEILLGNGFARLRLGPEFRYLEPDEAKRVLEELWGNPPGEPTWGMVFPADLGPFDEECWAVVLRYEAEGHVADDDAAEIDYDELLASMQSGAREENEARAAAGFGTLEIVGWAERPHYDAAQHELFWAKELQFSDAPVRTLNYDVRLLGRKGVLSMNAVADMDALDVVRRGMAELLGSVEFTEGNRYEDFDSSVDQLAAYGIGGLIAGKLALKAGLFKGLLALLVASKKLVLVALVALAALARRFLGRKRPEAGGETLTP